MGETDSARGTFGDRAGVTYWNELWGRRPEAVLSEPQAAGRWNYPNREVERFVRSRLQARSGASTRVLELGCARSIWLPYFAKRLGYKVTGIDYSPEGCKQARELLKLADVNADVVCADFFNPPDDLLASYDVVFSYGVVEHFDDTAACIASFAQYLAPGGTLLTVIPNMKGVPGFLQRELNRDVFDKHVPLDAGDLENAYRAAGLVVDEKGYLVSTNPGVINLEGLKKDSVWFAKKALMAALLRVSSVGWYIEEHIARLPTVGAMAAYVHCVGRKPQ